MFKLGRKDSPYCDYCNSETDNAEHTFFTCNRWADQRLAVEIALGVRCTPDNVVGTMLVSQTNWDIVATYVEDLLRQKKIEERERLRQ